MLVNPCRQLFNQFFSWYDRNALARVGPTWCPPPPPPEIRWGMIFVSARQGATAKLQEPGWGHIQGGMILGSQARGKLLFHDELLVFPQNASP